MMYDIFYCIRWLTIIPPESCNKSAAPGYMAVLQERAQQIQQINQNLASQRNIVVGGVLLNRQNL